MRSQPHARPGRRHRAWPALIGIIGSLALVAACGSSPTVDDPTSPPSAVKTATPATTSPESPPPASGQSPATVSVFSPTQDAPGASILAVVTVQGAGGDDKVWFDVDLAGRGGECVGEQWTHAKGRSQTCWVVLPQEPGKHTLKAAARLTDPAGVTRQTGEATRDVTGKGPVTDTVPPAERDKILTCGNTSDEVWLTFDDGFNSDAAMNSTLQTLERENVKAHFFATGEWARTNPERVARLREAGHVVGNHTSTHEWLNTLDDDALRDQISGGPSPDQPQLMRPGFGAGAFSAKVSDVAGSLGYQVCFWTVDTRDWDGVSADGIVETAMTGTEITPPLRPGGIVLMHMTGRHTPEALPTLISRIRGAGMTLEPLR